MSLASHLWRKLKQIVYGLGWLVPYASIDRNRYLRRLRTARFSDSRYLASQDRAQFTGEEVIVRTEDCGVACYFACHPQSSLEGMIIKHGFFQKSVFDTITPFVKSGSIMLDIGANVGAYAIPLARAFPAAEIHAFEPNPPVIQRLQENLALNRMMDENIKVFTCALSERRGSMILHAVVDNKDNYGLSSLREASLGHVAHIGTEVEVETLDALYLESGRPISVIKLDVQGLELSVLRGGLGVLERYRPVIVFEHEDLLFCNDGEAAAVKADLAKFFANVHYRCFYISRFGASLLTRVDWSRPLNGDVLAIPFPKSA